MSYTIQINYSRFENGQNPPRPGGVVARGGDVRRGEGPSSSLLSSSSAGRKREGAETQPLLLSTSPLCRLMEKGEEEGRDIKLIFAWEGGRPTQRRTIIVMSFSFIPPMSRFFPFQTPFFPPFPDEEKRK